MEESGTESSPSRDLIQCCDCGCHSSPRSFHRSVKRRHDELDPQNHNNLEGLSNNPKVHIENECELLRETVTSQQQSIQDLYDELEKERNAAASAADESMNVMQRLQNEKAELQMELRQYKLYAGEKMEHDLQEMLALEDLVNQREQTILALTCETQAYKHRMMSYGLTEAEAEGGDKRLSSEYDDDDLSVYDYPSLKCNVIENNQEAHLLESDIYVAEDGKYPPADSPLKTLDQRISEMETNPSFTELEDGGGFSSVKEKMVVVGQSPRPQRHFRRMSTKEVRPDASSYVESPKKVSYTENVDAKDDSSEIGDDMSDRVYTIDSVTEQKVEAETSDGNNVVFPREEMDVAGDPDITKLYMRLQALEADRESMKQALVSMRTEKAQMVLLKEIAQHLSKEVVPQRRLPLRKASTTGPLPFTPVFKWITSFVSWKRKARRSKYMYGMSANNMGLQMLLEKVPRSRKWRCLRSTQV